MLREIIGVRRNEGEDTRRWFTDKEWDLYVWYGAGGEITGFQLCYDKSGREKAFTWLSKRGYSHTKVNFDREVYPYGGSSMRSAVLVKDGLFDRKAVLARFRAVSGGIDREVVRFVSRMIDESPEPPEDPGDAAVEDPPEGG